MGDLLELYHELMHEPTPVIEETAQEMTWEVISKIWDGLGVPRQQHPSFIELSYVTTPAHPIDYVNMTFNVVSSGDTPNRNYDIFRNNSEEAVVTAENISYQTTRETSPLFELGSVNPIPFRMRERYGGSHLSNRAIADPRAIRTEENI